MKNEIIKKVEKILNKKLRNYHVLTKDGINLNITNGIRNYSIVIDKEKNIKSIFLLGD